MGDLRKSLADAVVKHVGRETRVIEQAFDYVALKLVESPGLAAAWLKALAEHVPDSDEPSPDFPDRTPSEILFDNLGARTSTSPGPGRRPSLTRAQVNALAEIAQLTGNWSKPRPSTLDSLINLGLAFTTAGTGAHVFISMAGKEWLRAAGLLS